MSEICKQCEDPSWTGDEPIVAPPLPHGEGGTSDFNELDNRPKYDGAVMSGNTNIPNLSSAVEQLGTDVEGLSGDVEGLSDDVEGLGDDIDGLSDDIDGIKGLIPEEATAENQLADKQYVDDVAGGGGVKVLTSADFNYPTNNPSLIALWLLDEGQYVIAPHTNYVALRNGSSYNTSNQVSAMVYVKPTDDYRGAYATNNTNQALSYLYFQVDKNGDNGVEYKWITNVIDNLNNSNSSNALSANQGRILKEMIEKTKLWVNFSDIPTSGNTSTDVNIYTSRNMAAGESLTGQLFFNWLNGNSDGNYKLCIKDIDGNNSDEELFLTAVKKAPMNTVSPSSSAIAEMIFTYYDSTGTKTLKVWTEDTGSGKFKISLT